MATIPPPYTPPYSPRDQARFARDAARAQRDAMRAQRDYWRMQRRPSIVRPLVLVVIGVIALLIETGKVNGMAFWDWYVQWWPLLLIGIGLLSLGEWWLERDRPYGARHGVGGIVFWIIVLALLGSTSHLRMWHGMPGFHFDDGDDDLTWHLFGQEHSATAQLDQAVPANASLRIQDPRGDVTVSPSSDGRIHVTAHDVVYASSDKDANKQLDRVAPHLTVSGSQILLATADINAAHADLTVEVPADAALDIDAGRGEVTIDGTKNSVTVTSGHGDVKLDNIAGSVHTHMSKGDLSATAVTGEFVGEGRMDDVSLSDIRNHVSLSGDFFGDMHLQQIAGPLNVHSSRTDIAMVSVPGNLTLDSDDLTFKNVTGPVRVVTRSKDIEGTLVKGPSHIEDNNGDVSLSALAPVENIDIDDSNGSVDLTLPESAKFDLDASTKDGDLSTDFDLPRHSQGEGSTASGKVGGGGSTVNVVAAHGDVHIRKAGVSAKSDFGDDDDGVPAPPKPPKPPKFARHLRSDSNDEPRPSVQ